jgi:hypothetical protein
VYKLCSKFWVQWFAGSEMKPNNWGYGKALACRGLHPLSLDEIERPWMGGRLDLFQDPTPAFSWLGWRKPRNTSARAVGNPAINRTQCLLNVGFRVWWVFVLFHLRFLLRISWIWKWFYKKKKIQDEKFGILGLLYDTRSSVRNKAFEIITKLKYLRKPNGSMQGLHTQM